MFTHLGSALVQCLKPGFDDVGRVDKCGRKGPGQATGDEGPPEHGLGRSRSLLGPQGVEVGKEGEVADGEGDVSHHRGRRALVQAEDALGLEQLLGDSQSADLLDF